MKIFALETNVQKTIDRLLSPGEQVVLFVRYQGFRFLLGLIRQLVMTLIIAGIAYEFLAIATPLTYVEIGAGVLWILSVFIPFLFRLIDWRYDCILLTNKKLVSVDQTLIFRCETQAIDLEKIVRVELNTELYGLTSMGKLSIHYEENIEDLTFRYVPHASSVAAQISAQMDKVVRNVVPGA